MNRNDEKNYSNVSLYDTITCMASVDIFVYIVVLYEFNGGINGLFTVVYLSNSCFKFVASNIP